MAILNDHLVFRWRSKACPVCREPEGPAGAAVINEKAYGKPRRHTASACRKGLLLAPACYFSRCGFLCKVDGRAGV